MSRLFDQVTLNFTIKRNNFTYNLSKLFLVKHLVPKNPYSPFAPKRVKIFFSIITVLILIFNTIVMNFINALLINGPLLFSGITGLNVSFTTFAFVSTIFYAVVRGMYRPTYIISEPQTLETLYRYIKINGKTISINNRILYFIQVVINRIGLLLLMPNLISGISIILTWYGISIMMDSYHIILFDKFNLTMPSPKNSIMIPYLIIYTIMIFAPFALLMFNLVVNINVYLLFSLSLSILILNALINNKLMKSFDFHLYVRRQIIAISLLASMTSPETKSHYVKDANVKKLEYNQSKQYKGEKFKYLNNIFFDRHKKVYSRKRLIVNGIFLSLIILLLLLRLILKMDFVYAIRNSIDIDDFTLNITPLFLLIYYLNMGEEITSALFYNCDASMLRYRSYNNGSNVLPNFIERLKHMVIIHIPQAILLSLLMMTFTAMFNPDVNLKILMMIFTVISMMTIFYCIHSLVMYFVIQPFNEQMQIVSYAYKIVTFFTYFITYMIIDFKTPLETLTISVIIFSLIYIIIASVLMYFVAPKTFKLK